MNTIDGASPEVSGKRDDQESNPANALPGYVTMEDRLTKSGHSNLRLSMQVSFIF